MPDPAEQILLVGDSVAAQLSLPPPERPTVLARMQQVVRRRYDDSEFVTEPGVAALQGARPEAHWILWSVVAFILAALAWASIATLDEVTVGQGQVIPSGRVQIVQNLEGGIVSEIFVEPGQIVSKGQALMRIDDKRFSSSYQEGDARDAALRARIARLSAEADLKPFEPPEDLAQEKPELVQQERELYESRHRDFEAGLAVLHRQAEQRHQELSEMEAKASQLQDSYELLQQELGMTRPAAEKGVISKVDLIRLERQATDLKGELDRARMAIPRLRTAEREVAQKSEQFAADFRAQASHDLSDARAEQSVVTATKVALEDRLDRTTVRAPVAGTVKQVKVNTVGGVVQPGMDLVEIVPNDETLLVEARVRPADIAFLRPGLQAMVKLSAYDFSIYGGFEGTVEHISADAIIDDRPGARGESYYLVRVRTQHGSHGAGDKRLKILPGMQATVDIRTGRKTVLQYLLKPILRAKQTALRER